FRRVLTVNAVLTGLFIMACAAFTPGTPVWLLIGILLVGGFFRSLQFTGVNTLTYADIAPERMSSASSFAAMAQQLGISLGDGMVAFVVIGVLCAASTLSFRRLAPQAGAQLQG